MSCGTDGTSIFSSYWGYTSFYFLDMIYCERNTQF
nr:MAG TPA: hypothetical protein [Caudoviricetes sp.]